MNSAPLEEQPSLCLVFKDPVHPWLVEPAMNTRSACSAFRVLGLEGFVYYVFVNESVHTWRSEESVVCPITTLPTLLCLFLYKWGLSTSVGIPFLSQGWRPASPGHPPVSTFLRDGFIGIFPLTGLLPR